MNGRRGTVFGLVDWTFHPQERCVILGQQGNGRSALLLALGGRLKGVEGSILVDGFDGVRHPRKLRHLTAVARIADLADLEHSLTVGESRDERALTEGMSVRQGRRRFSYLQEELGHSFDTDDLVEHLPAVERTLLAAVLGCLRPSRYVLLDDLDQSLTDEQLLWIHEQLDVLQAGGHTFVVSALDTSPVPPHANVLRLPAPHPLARAAGGSSSKAVDSNDITSEAKE